jgi:hypothetical protein
MRPGQRLWRLAGLMTSSFALALATAQPGHAEDACLVARADLASAQAAFPAVRNLFRTAVQRQPDPAFSTALKIIAAHEATLQRLYSAEQQAFAALAAAFVNPDVAWQSLKADFLGRAAMLPCETTDDARTELIDALLLAVERQSNRYGTLNRNPMAPSVGLVSSAPFREWLRAFDAAAASTPDRIAAERALSDWQRSMQQASADLQRTLQTPQFQAMQQKTPQCWPKGQPRLPARQDSAIPPATAQMLATLAARAMPFPVILVEKAVACEAGLADARQLDRRNLRGVLTRLGTPARQNATQHSVAPAADRQKLEQLVRETGLLQRQQADLPDAAVLPRLGQLGRAWGMDFGRPPLDAGLRVPGATTPTALEGLIAFSTLHGDYAARTAADAASGRIVFWQPWVQALSCTVTANLKQQLRQIQASCLTPTEQQVRLGLLRQLQ